MQNANSAIIRWKADGTLTFFNEYAQSFFGWSAEEAVGQHVSILVPDKELSGADLRGLVQDIVDHPERYQHNINENVCRDGRRVWMNWTNRAVLDRQGKVTEIFAVGSDITQRKKAEDALKKNEQRYRNFFNNNHAVMLLIDPQTERVVNANPAASAYYGYTLDEITSLKITDINVLPADQVRTEMQLARSQQRRHFFFKHRLADGQVRDVQVYSGSISVDGRELLYSIVFDITERKRAEELLRESENRYRTVGETIPYGIWQADAAGACTYISDSFLEMTGMTFPELEEFGWLHLLPQEDRDSTREHWLRCVRTGEDFQREHKLRSKDGSTCFVLAIGRPVRNDKGEITSWVGINLNISPRKRAELALQEAHAELETKVKERTAELREKESTAHAAEPSSGHGRDDQQYCPSVAPAPQCAGHNHSVVSLQSKGR